MRFTLLCICLALTHSCGTLSAAHPQIKKRVVVYAKEGRFAGWPANHGMWMWGNELLVGFSIGAHKDLGPERHNIDREQPEHHVMARSLNGGLSWTVEFPAEKGMLINQDGMRHGITDPQLVEPDPAPIKDPLDFTHPDFCMTIRFAHVHGGASRLYYSYNRGRDWQGPYRVPHFDQPGVIARTDYLATGARDCHVFLTAAKTNGKEGRVFCARTQDGGRNWKFLSFIGPEPPGFAIMPSTVRISRTHLVTTTRRREGAGEPKKRWIDAWRSADNGSTWTPLGNPVEDLGEGNPPSLVRLKDGRLCLTYGVRKPPFEIQARFSPDDGQSWSEPIVLETGGGGRDIGYPRSVQRPDGKVVTVYYFQPSETPYRRLVAVVWDPSISD